MAQAIIVGFGFRQSAKLDSFENAFAQTKITQSCDGIAVPDDKVAHEGLQAFAKKQGLAIFGVSQAVIAAAKTPSQSHIIRQKRQTGSVAEAVAIALFQEPASFLVTRCISQDRTAVCAIAKGELL